MNLRGPAIALGFFGLGFLTLSIHLLFSITLTYFHFQLLLSLSFIMAGIVILIMLSTDTHYADSSLKTQDELSLLNQDLHFFLLEIAKVASIFTIGFIYPILAFLIFLLLDCLDGMLLPYSKRSMLLRHRIDKTTDFVCQIPMYLVALEYWPELAVLFTIFFAALILKTLLFVWSGNRNILIYLPGFFMLFYLCRLILLQVPTLDVLLTSKLYYVMLFTFLILIITVSYEATYNGLLFRFRYAAEV